MKNKLSWYWQQLKKEKWLLLLCLVLAFLAWQGIRSNIGFEVSVSNILVEVDAPEGWAVWDKSVQKVNILFRGSREDIRYLNNEQLRVVIPMPKPERGREMVVRLKPKYLKNPTSANAKVVGFSPDEVVVKLDQESTKLLPVKATISGSLPEGLEIERMVSSPATVRVTGRTHSTSAVSKATSAAPAIPDTMIRIGITIKGSADNRIGTGFIAISFMQTKWLAKRESRSCQ